MAPTRLSSATTLGEIAALVDRPLGQLSRIEIEPNELSITYRRPSGHRRVITERIRVRVDTDVRPADVPTD